MKKSLSTEHPVAGLFSVLLFGLFAVFLILMLLFSARIYQQEAANTSCEDALETASAYITNKFRQHDTENGIFSGALDGIPAFCFRDTIEGQEYITYIYFQENSLKELFTASGSYASANAGTVLAELSDFRVSEPENGLYQITLQNTAGNIAEFYLYSTAEREAVSR